MPLYVCQTYSRRLRLPLCNEQERLRELAREKEDAAVAECSFAPAINRRSDRLMADRSTVLRVPALPFLPAGQSFASFSSKEWMCLQSAHCS